ncbi:MAG TPA: hypothetical protein VMT59_02345 [Gaiellaceae bacterium]|nr:hypothetical protein [Gaiellaceae bacterium]
MSVRRPLLFVTVCALVAGVTIAAAATGAGRGAGPGQPAASRSVALTNETWVCNGPVDLDSVTVTMTSAGRRGGDAVHLADGCTGRIGLLTVTEYVADGVKVSAGAHDLTIGGGTIRCLAKTPTVHQDGIQAMGGARITFKGLTVSCGRPGESLINSNLFIKQGGRSTTPPTDVVCVDCDLGGGAAHTVNIQASVRSGVVDSSLCTAKYPKLTLTIGPDAVAPVDVRNTISGC